MPNYFWYLAVSFTTTIIFFYTLFRKRDPKIFALYLFMSGLIFIFEFFVFVIFKAYVYNPEIFQNPYFDNVMGSNLSNAVIVPMATSVIAAFEANLLVIILVAGLLSVIDEFFVFLEIYKHFWWSGIYTFVGVIAASYIAKTWLKLLHNNLNKFVGLITLSLASLAIQGTFVFYLVAIFNVYFYKIGWFENATRDHVAFATVIISVYSLLFSHVIVFKRHWIWITIMLFIMSFFDWYLLKQEILKFSEHWSLVHFVAIRLLVLGIMYLIASKILLGKNTKA